MEDKEIILKGRGQTIGLVIMIGATVFLFTMFFLDSRNRREIKRNFEKTPGILINYKDVSSVEGSRIMIEYTFRVDSKTYSRKISTKKKFKKCHANPLKCLEKKHWVIYQKGNPENSLINIEYELGEDSISFPHSLDDFL